MSMSKEQERRLMELLGRLAAREAGEPVDDLERSVFGIPDFNGQEHTDAITLSHMGWIRSRQAFRDVANTWSSEGIYAFDLTEDGKAALDDWDSEIGHEVDVNSNTQGRRSRPMVMVVHGSTEGRVPQVVDDIRLWCFEHGIEAYKAADLPNSGRFINDKVNSTINEADYYIVVLTADEELKTGVFRPRPNAMIEMGRLLDRDPKLVCVLKEGKAEMPSDYSNLVTESLDNWQSVLQRELREIGLL